MMDSTLRMKAHDTLIARLALGELHPNDATVVPYPLSWNATLS